MEPAGFGPRARAFALDYLLIAAYLLLVVLVFASLQWLAPDWSARLFARRFQAQGLAFGVVTFPVFLYFTAMEGSARQATWGKRRLGLRVVDRAGRRPGWGRAALRSGLKLLPWEAAHTCIWALTWPGGPAPAWAAPGLAGVWAVVLFYLTLLAFRADHRTPYDWLSGTRVVKS